MSVPRPLQQVEELTRQAEEALARGATEQALELARGLERLGHVGAFEVRARAQWSAGRREESLAGLAHALARVPTAARLWLLFGGYQREVGQLDEADASFRNALRCEGADRAAVALQVGLLRVRQGRSDEALEMLALAASLGDPGQARQAVLLRARLLVAESRPAEALAVLEGAPAVAHGDSLEVALLVESARAHEAVGDPDGAERLARRARELARELEGRGATGRALA